MTRRQTKTTALTATITTACATAAIAASVLLTGCGRGDTATSTENPATPAPTTAETTPVAPAVSLPMKTVDAAGLRQVIADQKGKKAVVVNVWATYCAPCVAEFPHFVEMAQANRDDVEVVFVSADFPEELAKAQDFLTSQGVDWQTYLIADASDQDFFPALSPDWTGGMPATLIIARDGQEVVFHDGEMDAATLAGHVATATGQPAQH